MCDDILSERKRIGGDWAIATIAMTREVRDHIRSVLGPDLVFVALNMDPEENRKRVKDRHHGEEDAVEHTWIKRFLASRCGILKESASSRNTVNRKLLVTLSF